MDNTTKDKVLSACREWLRAPTLKEDSGLCYQLSYMARAGEAYEYISIFEAYEYISIFMDPYKQRGSAYISTPGIVTTERIQAVKDLISHLEAL